MSPVGLANTRISTGGYAQKSPRSLEGRDRYFPINLIIKSTLNSSNDFFSPFLLPTWRGGKGPCEVVYLKLDSRSTFCVGKSKFPRAISDYLIRRPNIVFSCVTGPCPLEGKKDLVKTPTPRRVLPGPSFLMANGMETSTWDFEWVSSDLRLPCGGKWRVVIS